MKKGYLFLICGPSGVGKSTAIKNLLEDDANFIQIPSYTTRPVRLDDKETNSRIHISDDEFKKLIADNVFVDWVKYSNHYYGKKKTDIQKALEDGKIVLLDTDYRGITPYTNQFPNSKLILLQYRSLDDLKPRILKSRRDISQEEIDRRYKIALNEIEEFKKYKFDYTITTYNDDSPNVPAKEMKMIISDFLKNQPNTI